MYIIQRKYLKPNLHFYWDFGFCVRDGNEKPAALAAFLFFEIITGRGFEAESPTPHAIIVFV